MRLREKVYFNPVSRLERVGDIALSILATSATFGNTCKYFFDSSTNEAGKRGDEMFETRRSFMLS
jgi:hypothetical protein